MKAGILFIKSAKLELEKSLESGELSHEDNAEIIIKQLGEIIELVEYSMIEAEKLYKEYKELPSCP